MSLTHPPQDIAFAEYRQTVRDGHEPLAGPTQVLRSQTEHRRLKPLEAALSSPPGASHRQGDITKTSNGHTQRAPVEAVWNFRFPPRIRRVLQIRQENQSQAARDIAWQARLRLAHRFRGFSSRKPNPNRTCVAMTREPAGFVWDIARQAKAAAA